MSPRHATARRSAWSIARRAGIWLAALLLLNAGSVARAVVCGHPISDEENHWLVNLSRGPKVPQLCSGTLLSPDVVITAWHCFDQGHDMINVALGASRESLLAGAPVRIPNADVALVRLKQAIGEASDEFPGLAESLPESGRIETAGWGVSAAGPLAIDRLSCPAPKMGRPHRAEVSTVDPQLCRPSGNAAVSVSPRMLCAHGSSGAAHPPVPNAVSVFTKPGAGACEGDSGGPLLMTTGVSPTQIIGIQSEVVNITKFNTAKSCAYNPAIYTTSMAIFSHVQLAMKEMVGGNYKPDDTKGEQ